MRRVLVVALLLAGCSKDQQPAAPAVTHASTRPGFIDIPADSPKLEQIRVAVVQKAEMPTDEFSAPGKIEANPNRVSKVLLPVAGRVTEVMVRFGDAVKKGQPLVSIESPEADAAASASLQAEAAVTQAKSNLSRAQSDYDRASDLFKADAIAKKEVLHAENGVISAQTALEQAQAARDQALRRLEMFGLKPGTFRQRIVVPAPLSGKITEINVVDGEFRNDTSAPMMTIADLSTVWVSSDVPEGQIRLVQVGERFDVTLTAYPGEVFTSRVARIADTVDPQNRTIEVWAELANPNGRLRPEMFGQIRHVESTHVVPVVPATAVIQNENRNVVWRERGKGRFQQVEVTVGKRQGELMPVTAGVKDGDRVVVDGAMLLRGQ